jgi:REP element-mobilizing transposase RayT
MPNTYTQLYVQAVFPVKYREALILPDIKNEFFGVIGKEINKTECKTLIVNGTEDHVHLLFGWHPTISIADIMKMVKGNSSKWMNDSGLLKRQFQWQQGYGAFSYSKSDIPRVYQYILNQEEHHKTRSFLEEYIDLLIENGVEYDERYLFHHPL